MSRFQITLVRPQGFIHTEAFREVAETLLYGLQSLGHSAAIRENACDANATNVLLGAHLLLPQQVLTIPRGSILYNLEQLGGPSLPAHFYEVARQHQVWDYSLQNVKKWEALGCDHQPVHVPLGYTPQLTRIKDAQDQDIDVLFYGSLNDRRKFVLTALRDAGLRVHVLFGVYGAARDEFIARSKIILNVHFYDTQIFETVRVSYLLANSKAVVTECSSGAELEPGLANAVLGVPYDSLVDKCISLLRDEKQRAQLQTQGFLWFSQRKESEILTEILQGYKVDPTPACKVEAPAKLNLGSGKDWREDHFNVDIDAYWEPDAVLDFNQPLPIEKPIETERFGPLVLKNDSFDEIIANDSLEHIPRLMTAMTSALNLLKVGGLFRISVPYDLSWGAWQDPTHVRAFNERSWLYYTEWFWYMGWTEARFDLIHFELGLSPIGEQLKQQQVKGEDIARHPRAVDQMRVILRKRLLTEAEKQRVTMYLKRPNRRAAAASSSEAQSVMVSDPV
jgi:SAM-dependent methyltransferase